MEFGTSVLPFPLLILVPYFAEIVSDSVAKFGG
jgi:hypothetical protein